MDAKLKNSKVRTDYMKKIGKFERELMPGEILKENGQIIRPVKVLDREYWNSMK
jgi:hypothetical protein